MAADSNDLEELGTITAINVTPFVDVVLVLLVIFMITAPSLMKDALEIQLPKAVSGDQKQFDSFGIAVTKQGQILVNGELTSEESLGAIVSDLVKKNPESQILLSADSEAKHGDVVKAVDIVKTAGALRFAFQIQKP